MGAETSGLKRLISASSFWITVLHAQRETRLSLMLREEEQVCKYFHTERIREAYIEETERICDRVLG